MTGRRRTVLLLGGTGFIGINLSQALTSAGHAVFVTGRTSNAHHMAGVQLVALPLHAVDDIAALVAREHIDTVVHLASAMKPSSTLADYLVEREAVMTPSIRLASALAAQGTRLIYFSSGGTIYGVGGAALVTEDDRCAPISFYGQSKLEMEAHLQFLTRTAGLRALILRPSNPFGLHQPLDGAQGLISVLLGRVAAGRELEVWGDGSTIRDYIHIDDLVASVRDLIECGTTDSTLNIGSGAGHSLLEVVRIVEEVTGRSVPLDFKPARAADVPRLVLDVARLRGLGLHRSRPLAAGIRQYAASLGLADA